MSRGGPGRRGGRALHGSVANHTPGGAMSVETQLDTGALEALRSTVRGGVITPSDEGYEQARQVYNGMIDKRPAVIVRCVDVADVIAAVGFGREQGLDTAIRGGGHNGGGLGTVDDGLVIDLSGLRG